MVTSAVGAPERSVTALITTVVPCTSMPMLAAGTPDCASAVSTPSSSRPGVVSALARTTFPSLPQATRSVKVPPMSMAARAVLMGPMLIRP